MTTKFQKTLFVQLWRISSIFMIIITMLVSTIGVNPVSAAPVYQQVAWYNSNWQYRKSITISHTQVTGDLNNFPILISITDADLAASAQPDGDDILFTDSVGSAKLNHEIELYTSTTGQLVAWVNVPNLSSTVDTLLYMYYGNASASNQQTPAAVFGIPTLLWFNILIISPL